MKPAPFEYHRPGSLDEALALLAEHADAKPLAGGQSLVPMLNFRLARPAALVDLAEIDGLAGDPRRGRRAGRRRDDPRSGTSSTRRTRFPLLREALRARRPHGHALPRHRRRLARPRRPDRRAAGVRARARRGAASPAAATIPAEEFFVSVFTTALEPDELLVEVRFPAPAGPTAFLELAHRHGDFAVVCVARAGDRVAVGGVGPTPMLWDGGALDPVGDLFAPGRVQGRRRAGADRADGGSMIEIALTVNGRRHERRVEPRLLLSDFLRHELALYGTHVGCEHGVCGACTVLLDGRPARSCLTLAVQADGREIRTVESLADGATLHPLQQAFHEHFGLQCGFCTPGILMTAAFLLEQNPDPTEEEIRAELAGNLCRCTGYAPIVDSILAAAAALRR